jgi:hypothetical protein
VTKQFSQEMCDALIDGDILWSEFADEMVQVPPPPQTKFRPGFSRFAGDSKKAAQLDEARTRMLGTTMAGKNKTAFDMPGIPGAGMAQTLRMPKMEMPDIEMPKMPWS